MVLLDACIGSTALRRGVETEQSQTLKLLMQRKQVAMIGAIRREVLGGGRSVKQYFRLRFELSKIPDQAVETSDFELASLF